jgi:hypothetical protein
MMVSMLVASWREKSRQEKHSGGTGTQDGQQRTKKFSRPSVRLGSQSAAELRKELQEAPRRQKSASSVSSTGLPSPTNGPSEFGDGGSPANLRTESELGTGFREVYRVALDLLLRRFQSRQQADRHKMKEMVGKFKFLLEVIAIKMTQMGTKEFTEAQVLPLLEIEGIEIQVWQELSAAILGGRVPLIRTEGQGGNVRFLFAYGSFQQFLSTGRRSPLSQPGTPMSGPGTPSMGNALLRFESSPLNLNRRTPAALGPPTGVAPAAASQTLWDIAFDLFCCTGTRRDATSVSLGEVVQAASEGRLSARRSPESESTSPKSPTLRRATTGTLVEKRTVLSSTSSSIPSSVHRGSRSGGAALRRGASTTEQTEQSNSAPLPQHRASWSDLRRTI